MREVLQNKRVSLKIFESREKELEEAKSVLSRLDKKMNGMSTEVYDTATASNGNELNKQIEIDMSEMSKMAKMRMARNAKKKKKKKKREETTAK